MKHIEEEIKERAQSTIEKVISRAKKIKEREIILARRKQEEIVSKEKRRIDEAIERKSNSLKAQLRLEYRIKEDRFKEELSFLLLDEVKKEINNLSDNVLLEAHKNLIREAVVVLGFKKIYVKTNKKISLLIKEQYEEVISFIKKRFPEFESLDIDDSLNSYGVIVGSLDKKAFFNNTFERRFKRFDENFKERILNTLKKYEK